MNDIQVKQLTKEIIKQNFKGSPFCIITSLTGSGKTVLLADLLAVSDIKYDHTIVVCKTLVYSDYYKNKKMFKHQFDDYTDTFQNWMASLLKRKQREEKVLLVIDDCVTSEGFKKQKNANNNFNMLDTLSVMGRHENVTTICILQKLSMISTVCRTNCRLFFTFKIPNQKEEKIIIEEFINVTSKTRTDRELIKNLTDEVYQCVCISRMDPSIKHSESIYVYKADPKWIKKQKTIFDNKIGRIDNMFEMCRIDTYKNSKTIL